MYLGDLFVLTLVDRQLALVLTSLLLPHTVNDQQVTSHTDPGVGTDSGLSYEQLLLAAGVGPRPDPLNMP